MPTATADPQAEQTETKKVTFVARSPNQIVTRIAEDVIHDLRGRPVEHINRKNELRKLKERGVSEDSPEYAYYAAPWKIEFGQRDPSHQFTTDNPVLIEFLRNHENFGIDGPSAFWELEVPGEEKPSATEQHVRLGKAQALGDIDEVEAVLKLERETHNRETVIQGAEAALAILRELDGQVAPAGDTNQTEDGPPSTSQP